MTEPTSMLLGHLAFIAAALFAGAAIYINVAEQPARLALPDGPMLAEWQQSYKRAAVMQGALALIGGVLGFAEFYSWPPHSWRWLLGGLVLLSAWPYTVFVIKRTNEKLNAMQPATAGPETRRLVETWGRLHAVRSLIGAVSVLVYLWAAS